MSDVVSSSHVLQRHCTERSGCVHTTSIHYAPRTHRGLVVTGETHLSQVRWSAWNRPGSQTPRRSYGSGLDPRFSGRGQFDEDGADGNVVSK